MWNSALWYKVENALVLNAVCLFPTLYSPTFFLRGNLAIADLLGHIGLMIIKCSSDYIHIEKPAISAGYVKYVSNR